MVKKSKTRFQVSIDKDLLQLFKQQLGRDSPGVSISTKITEWIIAYVHKLKR